MVSGKHRFHGLSSLRFVHSRGRVVRGPYFTVKYALNNRRSTYRVAVVVSKKVSKSAVVRNRIRRRLYELIRQQDGVVDEPFDIVILVHSNEVAELPAHNLNKQVIKQLKIAKIIK